MYIYTRYMIFIKILFKLIKNIYYYKKNKTLKFKLLYINKSFVTTDITIFFIAIYFNLLLFWT